MKLKQCHVCKRKVPWLVMHVHAPQDKVVVSMIERALPGWSREDGICLPCYDRYRRNVLADCFDIRITCN